MVTVLNKITLSIVLLGMNFQIISRILKFYISKMKCASPIKF